MQLLLDLFPNMAGKLPELWESTLQTLYMTFLSGIFSFSIGLVLGIVLMVTSPWGVLPNKAVYSILDKIINLFRSIPFIILLSALVPVTRLISGTAIGTTGAIFPLVVGTIPFYAKQVETALAEVDRGIVDAAKSMGNGTAGIIFRVYLRESIPALVRVTIITLISLVGLTAMAGAVGGGGLGDFAIRYGHQRNQPDVTIVTVLVLLILVYALQWLGNRIIQKTTH